MVISIVDCIEAHQSCSTFEPTHELEGGLNFHMAEMIASGTFESRKSYYCSSLLHDENSISLWPKTTLPSLQAVLKLPELLVDHYAISDDPPPHPPLFSLSSPCMFLARTHCSYPRGSTKHRLIPTLDQVLQEMEKAEGVPKEIKRRKRKLSTYIHVRKKKKTGRAVVAQQSVEEEETNPRNEEEEEEEEEELPTLSATGAQSGGSLLSVAACEDSSSVSSEDVDTLMLM